MRTFTSVISVLFLSLTVACGGGGGGGSAVDAAPVNVDAAPVNVDAAPVNVDAAPVGGNGAAALGQICNQAAPCPTGTMCAIFAQGATEGMCILPCTMQGMADVCSAADGFPGPGLGFCGLSAQDGTFSCGIGCGANNGGDMSCPTGLECSDAIGSDLCLPPTPPTPTP